MNKPHILLTGPLIEPTVQALEDAFTVLRLWEQPDQTRFVRGRGRDVRAAVSTAFIPMDSDLIASLPNLEIIANFGVGYDGVDVDLAVKKGVMVTNTPGVLDHEVADFTIGLLLATIRRIPQSDAYLRSGRWQQGAFPLSPSLQGKSVGIAGLGNIGKLIAKRLEAFEVELAYFGRTRQPGVPYPFYSDLRDMAEAVDVLVMIVPGGAETRHLVGADVLKALGPEGTLINVARGSVVDENALVRALEAGDIGAAGIDVFDDEPNVPAVLFTMPNVVLTPHIGSGSLTTRIAMGQLVVDNLVSWFAGTGAVTPVPECEGMAAPK